MLLPGLTAAAMENSEAQAGPEDFLAQLDARGLELSAAYTGEFAAVLSGGARRESTSLGLAEAALSVDGARLGIGTGTLGYLHVIRPHGGDPAEAVGDAQGVSNIAASSRGRILEAWLQQSLFDDRLSLLASRYDLNSEFYHLQAAMLFLNSSFGIGPELSQIGVAGPSLYPDTAIAARAELRPAAGVVLRGAVLNGVPVGVTRADGRSGIRRSGDGLLAIGEAALLWPAGSVAHGEGHAAGRHRPAGRDSVETARDGKLAFGAWRFRSTFESLSPGAPAESGATGLYLLGEHTLVRGAGESARRLRAFAQLGFGDADVARFKRYLGAGFVLDAPVPSRPDDQLGLAFAQARNGAPFLDAAQAGGGAADRAETAVELTWRAQLRNGIALQPSLQYVVNPGTDPALDDALTLLVRLQAGF
jgi:porin